MAHKSSSKDKHKKKHKKEKSKKHKREKSKKSKHRSKSTDSSDSDSDESLKNEARGKQEERPEWGFLETVLSDSCVTVKDKKEKPKRPSPERPGQNIRELNPYWKDGGCGLPPTKPEKGASGSTSFNRNHYSSRSRYNSQPDFDSESRKLNFLKPGESTSLESSRSTYSGNWRKKEANTPELNCKKAAGASENIKNENPSSTSKSVSNENLNKIAAKLVKAEIMGDSALISKLKAELEAAKMSKNENSSSNDDSKGKTKEIVVLTDRPHKKPHDSKQSHVASKRQKVVTHDSGQRVCYFPDDDKYSLKNLFEKEKGTPKEEILLPVKVSSKSSEDFDDIYLDAAASNKMQQKMEDKKKQKEMKQAIVKHKTLEGCRWCLDNRNASKHLIVSTGSKCYLCLPEEESMTEGHCLIVPLQHEISAMHLDEDVWSEIKTYQRVLTQMFLEQDQDVVFFENARSFKHFPHCFIQCVPLSKEMGDLAPIYFQKAISESESEWSTNKKLIDFRQKDLRKSIPKGLPYFAIMFGTSGGFAHIIEDEYLFKRNFAEEVLGGMMDLDHKKWRKQQKDNFRAQREKVFEFLKNWKKFEFNENASDSESSSSD